MISNSAPEFLVRQQIARLFELFRGLMMRSLKVFAQLSATAPILENMEVIPTIDSRYGKDKVLGLERIFEWDLNQRFSVNIPQ